MLICYTVNKKMRLDYLKGHRSDSVEQLVNYFNMTYVSGASCDIMQKQTQLFQEFEWAGINELNHQAGQN